MNKSNFSAKMIAIMSEPIERDPHPQRNRPKTERFDLLFKSGLFDKRAHEQDGWYEQKRDALIVVHDANGEPLQFIVTLLLDRHAKILYVTLEPTQGAAQDHPELGNVKFTGFEPQAKGVAVAIQQAVKKLEEAGFNLDPRAAQMLYAR